MRFASFAVGIALLTWPASSAADPRVCIEANERGNKLRWESKLLAAKDEYLRCSEQTCPDVVREECTELARKVEADIPTLVFAVTDAEGHDAPDVTVSIDGSAVGPVGASAVPLDPGTHRLRFHGSRGAAQQLSVVARLGEKNRLVRVQLQRAEAPGSTRTQVVSASPERPVPVATWVLGGVGLAALGSFGLFGVLGKVEQGCAPNCTADEVGTMRRDYAIADVSLGVGLLSLGAAAVLYFTRPSVRPARVTAMVGTF